MQVSAKKAVDVLQKVLEDLSKDDPSSKGVGVAPLGIVAIDCNLAFVLLQFSDTRRVDMCITYIYICICIYICRYVYYVYIYIHNIYIYILYVCIILCIVYLLHLNFSTTPTHPPTHTHTHTHARTHARTHTHEQAGAEAEDYTRPRAHGPPKLQKGERPGAVLSFC